MKKELRKKVFITGGTGSVGQALIESFASSDFEIYFQFNKDIKTAGYLSNKFKAKKMQIDFLKKFELPDIKFDIIINNAGINITYALTHNVTNKDWEKTLSVNLAVPFYIVKMYLPNMISKKWGRIINISSIYGLRGCEQNLPYTVSKHGLTGITQTIAKEYAIYGITCNEICPAAIRSNLMNRLASEATEKSIITKEEYFREVREEIPAKRMAEPSEVASLALYLSSDAAGFINGCSIPVDGGLIC